MKSCLLQMIFAIFWAFPCQAQEQQSPPSPLIYYEEPELAESMIAELSQRDNSEIHFGFFPDALSLKQETVNKLQNIKKIRHLGFYLSNCRSIEWSSVASIRSLRSLSIMGEVRFSSADLRSFVALPDLKDLSLMGEFDLKNKISWMNSESSLKNLTLIGLGKASFCNIVASARLTNLSSLDLREEEIDVEELRTLARAYAEQLTHLQLAKLAPNSSAELAAFTALESLSIKFVRDLNGDLTFISKLNGLQVLAVQDANLDAEQIASLAHHPTLRHIQMNDVVFNESHAEILDTIPLLETVQFAGDERPRKFLRQGIKLQ